MNQYFVMVDGDCQGPLSKEELVQKLHTNQVSWTAYFKDNVNGDWKVVLEDQDFLTAFKANKPAPGLQANHPVTNEYLQALFSMSDWHVLKGQTQHGPFSYVEMVKLLQQKKIFEFEFIWSSKLSGWKRVSEVDDFKVDRIKALKASGLIASNDVFFRRKYPRAQLEAPVLVHNNKEVWKAQTNEVGPGGASLVIEAGQFEMGQNLFLHLKPDNVLPAFNAIATVVSCQNVSEGQWKYGVKFTKVSQDVQQAILDFAEKASPGTGESPALAS